MFLLIVFVPMVSSNLPASNPEYAEMQSVYYAAFITHHPIKMTLNCSEQPFISYGWLNDGTPCENDYQCKTNMQWGVSHEVEARAFCCMSDLARGTCGEYLKDYPGLVGGSGYNG